MKRDAIDLGTMKVFTLFKKYFIPTLFGMLSMSAVTAMKSLAAFVTFSLRSMAVR